jgi:flagellar hook-basal body complex protein FliE
MDGVRRIDPRAAGLTDALPIRGTDASSVPVSDGARPEASVTFESVLGETIGAASDAQKTAASKAEALAAGSIDDIHGTMIAVKEAEISMKLVGTIRNKLLEAFHEIWRTSV